jgi:hypothetical protein
MYPDKLPQFVIDKINLKFFNTWTLLHFWKTEKDYLVSITLTGNKIAFLKITENDFEISNICYFVFQEDI